MIAFQKLEQDVDARNRFLVGLDEVLFDQKDSICVATYFSRR